MIRPITQTSTLCSEKCSWEEMEREEEGGRKKREEKRGRGKSNSILWELAVFEVGPSINDTDKQHIVPALSLSERFSCEERVREEEEKREKKREREEKETDL